jgi:signal transduction histidine kinase
VTRGDFAEISVSDTGIGVPDDQQQAVFDKFYQIKAATTGGSEGAGLGLAITKRLVAQHGGSIWLRSAQAAPAARLNRQTRVECEEPGRVCCARLLESKPGCGSCFTFTIPLAQQTYEESASGGR